MKNSKLKILISPILIFTFLVLSFPSFSARAQVRPVYDYGAIGLGQLLKRLNNTKSAMHIGAHPDDEDSALLAYLARGENARTAYLSMTRGDGGQNIIGSELFEPLGVIRTEELLQARRLDGAEQYFTRAFDYGFSKTLAEAREKWDEKIILCDAVRAIRTFRPLVVISRFSGTPADGHGQHQFAGYIAPLAVKAAADSNQCQDAGAPWQVLKFYVSQGFRSQAQPTLRLNTGKYDYLLGRSYFEIAMEGRSQHKTQEQGVLELRGEQFSGLNLVESRFPKAEKETSVFDGIDVSLTGQLKTDDLPKGISKELLGEIQSLARSALSEYESQNPQKIIPILVKGLELIRQSLTVYGCVKSAEVSNGRGGCDETFTLKEQTALRTMNEYLGRKNAEFVEALVRAGGVRIDALSDRETIVAGEPFPIVVRGFVPEETNARFREISLDAPGNWTVTKTDAPKETTPNFRRETADASAFFSVRISPIAGQNIYTQPYWLENPRRNYLFDWASRHDYQNLPFAPAAATARATVEIGGTTVQIFQPVEYRYADDVGGEVRRELNVVPKISVSLDQRLLIVPQSRAQQKRRITMSVTNNTSGEMKGQARLNLPAGWQVAPEATADFDLKTKGATTSIVFGVTIPPQSTAGSYKIAAEALTPASGETFTQEMHTLAYPHIKTHRYYTKAETAVNIFDLKSAPAGKKVGYIMGSGDAVPEAIRQMNFDVEMLNENDLNTGDLSRFDVIVAGIRAFQVRRDLVANNQRILDYVHSGGNLIVQYQRPEYENLLPFPAKIGARVVDENARISILEPQHPIFNFPNKITDKDFENWVQERNLYSLTTFDADYKPLLESHDPNEAENKGGLVVAEIGKGKYVYTSYAFFRQLPAGVSGAYRMFANLLSLSKDEKQRKRGVNSR